MQETNVPLCMKNAREEVLMALSSASREAADLHRQRADSFLKKAVRAMRREPEHYNDWSLLRASKQQCDREKCHEEDRG